MALTSQAVLAQMDLHSHMIPDSYLDAVKAHGLEMDEGFPIPAWSTDGHLKFMDEAGIRTSVLTMPAPQPYFGDSAESAAICRKFNEEAAALLAITEPSHILYGSDYPYVAAPALIGAKKALEGRLAAHGLNPEDILSNNAYYIFNIK